MYKTYLEELPKEAVNRITICGFFILGQVALVQFLAKMTIVMIIKNILPNLYPWDWNHFMRLTW